MLLDFSILNEYSSWKSNQLNPKNWAQIEIPFVNERASYASHAHVELLFVSGKYISTMSRQPWLLSVNSGHIKLAVVSLFWTNSGYFLQTMTFSHPFRSLFASFDQSLFTLASFPISHLPCAYPSSSKMKTKILVQETSSALWW